MTSGRWSKAEEATLRDMVATGASYAEIGQAMDRPRTSLYKKAQKLKIHPMRSRKRRHGGGKHLYSQEEKDRFKHLIAEGLTYVEIAGILGRSQSGVARLGRRLHIQSEKSLRRQRNKELRDERLKQCAACREILPLSEFYHGTHSYCTTCSNKYGRKREGASVQNRLSQRRHSARRNAKRKGIPFDITTEWLCKQWAAREGKCFYTGLQLSLDTNTHRAVSIDRLDSSLGYTKDNVVLCCSIVNRMKWTLSVKEFREWCRRVLKHLEQ